MARGVIDRALLLPGFEPGTSDSGVRLNHTTSLLGCTCNMGLEGPGGGLGNTAYSKTCAKMAGGWWGSKLGVEGLIPSDSMSVTFACPGTDTVSMDAEWA